MRGFLVLLTFILGFTFAASSAQARYVSLGEISTADLMRACNAVNGSFDAFGSDYSCIVENCDGKGGMCVIACNNEGGFVTCTGTVPRHAKVGEQLGNLMQSSPGMSLPETDDGPSDHSSDSAGNDGGRGAGGGGSGGGSFDPGQAGSTGNAGNDAGGGGTIIY